MLLGNSSEEEVLQIMESLDADKDSKISKEEFIAKMLKEERQ